MASSTLSDAARRQGLRHEAHQPRPAARGQGEKVRPVEPDPPGGGDQPGDGAKEGGFARPVRAEEREEPPLRHRGEGHVAQDGMAGIAGGERLDPEAHQPRPERWIRRKKSGSPTSEVTIPTGSCTPGISVLESVEASETRSAPVITLAGRKWR